MSKILALDTAADACSVALWLDGELISDHRLLPREHTKHMLPMIENILQHNSITLSELDGIAFGCGPGSFTGLRICGGIVQGLAFGADLPVVPVSSLAALAYPFAGENITVVASVDARMNELYTAVFQGQGEGFTVVDKEYLLAPESMSQQLLAQATPGNALIAAGSGWSYRDQFGDLKCMDLLACDTNAIPTAAAVAELSLARFVSGDTIAAAEVSPVYLRDSVAWQKSS
ncbi:tRNA threonylcarbamoyladenosine biosynthesis protein TsaB [Sinobacterium norvegicum]|uniref:tRNA threonylcarbamoyladenosine biosynthesis protein TsaB n=1 Tax=Sinobacterium norvegicum TaxID=1641715 RepID=A0ABN8EGB7_9GAMM|nr:tRNA (adenosine(37)-N6)-threonylcarbamoyltransferase complex dimerization subunit type 1 TsaB [Sinobacterium norvegicum]CAH0990402.1 tRNA threonylcarbamoyladenosine biosynthesis protein TsaB [Sinobacterium norvegicum]